MGMGMVLDSRVDEVRTRLALFIMGLEERGYKIAPLLRADLAELVINTAPFKIDVSDRDALERELTRRLGREFSIQLSQIMRLLGDPPRLENIPASFWEGAGAGLRKVITPVLAEIFRQQAKEALGLLPFGVDWSLINNRAIEWARQYAYNLVNGLDVTSLDTLQRAIGAFYEDGLTRGELEDLLRGSFGEMRAEMIAVTEVTRASSQGEIALRDELANAGIEMVSVWNTNNDELVCDICGPLNQKVQGDGWDEPPPAHPRCRCWVNLELPKAGDDLSKYTEFSSAREAEEFRNQYSKWIDGLSDEESQAIYDYTSGYYKTINQALRNGTPLSERAQEIVNLLDASLARASMPQNIVAYRDFGNFRFPGIGDVFTDRAFSSTSLLESGASHGGAGSAIRRVYIPRGSNAAYVFMQSANPGEYEVLISRGARYLVNGDGSISLVETP